MNKIYCPICNNEPNHFFRKSDVLYCQCSSCKTVFCGVLPQDDKVGGEFEKERNEKENHLRAERIEQLTVGIPKEELRILDYGCGNGLLVKYLKEKGYVNVYGFDSYNPDFYKRPQKESYDIITMIEVAEHLTAPFIEFDMAWAALIDGGYLMIETSFTDVAIEEGIKVEEFFYVSPLAGHSTFYSHHGLDVLMCLKGFVPRPHINRHVRVYQK